MFTKVTLSVAHWEIRNKIWKLVDSVKDPELLYELSKPENAIEKLDDILKNADNVNIEKISEYIKNYRKVDEIIKQIKKENVDEYKQYAKNLTSTVKNWLALHNK